MGDRDRYRNDRDDNYQPRRFNNGGGRGRGRGNYAGNNSKPKGLTLVHLFYIILNDKLHRCW